MVERLIMSVQSDLDFRFVLSASYSESRVIEALLGAGWTLDAFGQAMFLPVGESDYDWVSEPLGLESAIELVRNKASRGEKVGICLTWKESECGGAFVFMEPSLLSIGLNIGRRVSARHGRTDFDWYLKKLFPVFDREGIRVESFAFSEYS